MSSARRAVRRRPRRRKPRRRLCSLGAQAAAPAGGRRRRRRPVVLDGPRLLREHRCGRFVLCGSLARRLRDAGRGPRRKGRRNVPRRAPHEARRRVLRRRVLGFVRSAGRRSPRGGVSRGRLVVRPLGASSSFVRVVQRAEVALELRARDVQRGVGVQALEHLLEQVARVVLLAHHGAQVQQTAHLGIAAERLRAVSGGFRGAEGTEVSRDVFECARRGWALTRASRRLESRKEAPRDMSRGDRDAVRESGTRVPL